jgi:hypothetical protein
MAVRFGTAIGAHRLDTSRDRYEMQKIVVDQNVLRKPLLKRHAVDFPHVQYVLPDLAFLEMTKSAEWENTLKGSLETLAHIPERVFVCRAIGEALRFELEHKQSFDGHWIDKEATDFVRDLLRWVRTGVEGRAITQMRSQIDVHRVEAAKEYLDHASNKDNLQQLIDITEPLVDPQMLKAMRAAKATREERIGLLKEAGSQRPLLLRYLYIKAWQVMHWLEFGGYDDRPPPAVTNDDIDIQYVLPATFLDGLLSEEHRVNSAYSDVMVLIQS